MIKRLAAVFALLVSLGLAPHAFAQSVSSCPDLTQDLAPGSSGAEVSALQQYLAGSPSIYPQGIVSGYYGSLTEAAVQNFQAVHGIVSSGTPDTTGYGAVGPRTIAAIKTACGGSSGGNSGGGNSCPSFVEPLAPGDSGAGVSTLQQFLGKFPALYPANIVSGYYGSLTEAAVESFQTLENIVTSGTPDTTGYGAVGPRTAAALTTYCAQTVTNTNPPQGGNAGGGGGGGGGSGGGGTTDTQPPTVPTGVTGVPSAGQAFLSWNPSTDNVAVAGYYVYQNGAEVANVATTYFTATDLNAGQTYTFTVSAYDYSNNVSEQSTLINVTIPANGGGGDTQPPTAPTNLIASSTVDTASLSWGPSTDNVGVAGYQIYRNDAEVGTTQNTSYTDTGLTPNTSYSYYVTAYDAAGNVSTSSNTAITVTAPDTQPPTVPTGLTVSSTTQTTASLTWNASTDNVEVADYTIYRNGVSVGTASSTSFTDTGLTPSTTYTYTVDAVDTSGNHSAQSSGVQATTQAQGDTQPPSVPTGLAANNVTSSSLTLSWTASIDNVGVAGYDVYRNSVKVATVTSTSYNDSGLTASTTYSYTVDAFDAAGNYSAQSSPLLVTTQGQNNQAPSVPSGLAVTGTDTSSISLSWNASSGGVGGVAGYTVYRNSAAVGTTTLTTFTDTGLSASTTYSYTIDAYDTVGDHSDQSTPVQGTTQSGTCTQDRQLGGQFTLNLSVGSTDATTGGQVSKLQKALGVSPTGYFGPLTQAAVEKFQSEHGIVSEGTPTTTGYGNVGAKTRQELNQFQQSDQNCGPTVPTGLTGIPTTNTVVLAWLPSTNQNGIVTGYDVYRNGVNIGTSILPAYTDTGLASGTTYTYTVDAYDNNGDYSAQSSPIQVTTLGSGGSGTVLLGDYVTSSQNWNPTLFPTLEQEIGRTLGIENQGEGFGSDWGTDPNSSDIAADIASGTIPMISLKMDGGINGTCAKPQAIINGKYDNTWVDNNGVSHPGLIQLAQTFASYKSPVMIRFFKEFTDDQIDQCFYGIQNPASDPQVYGPEFVAVWQHVVNIFKQEGATNVQWIWGPSSSLFDPSKGNAWTYFYPGNNYVDWISNDAYNKSNTDVLSYPGSTDIADWYAAVSTLGKPLMQAETGAGYNGGLNPDPMTQWLTSATSYIQSAMPAMKAFVWWGAPGQVNYTLQGNGLNAYAQMGAQTYYSAMSASQYFSSAGSASGPTTPTNLAGTPGSGSVSLTWSPSTDQSGTIAYYDIFQTASSTGVTTEVGTTTTTSYTDTGLTDDSVYSYTVDAVDTGFNRSLLSSAVQVTPGTNAQEGKVAGSCPALSTPLALGSSGIEVMALQEYLGVSPATSYYGTLTQAAVENFQTSHNIVSSGSPSTTGYGAVGPRTILALNSACSSGVPIASVSPTTTATTTPTTTPVTPVTPVTSAPLPPTGLVAAITTNTSGTKQVVLTWYAPSVTPAGYYLYRSGSLLATITSGTSYVDNTAASGSQYTYSLKAFNAAGVVSVASNSASITVPSTSSAGGSGSSGSGHSSSP